MRKFFLLFTFLDIGEIEKICAGDINAAKERLAYEVTAIIHGKDEADKALAGAKAAFGGEGDKASMPTVELAKADFEAGLNVCDLYFNTKLCATKSDARRLIQQGGASVNGKNISDVKALVSLNDVDSDGEFVVKAGKKKMVRVVLK